MNCAGLCPYMATADGAGTVLAGYQTVVLTARELAEIQRSLTIMCKGRWGMSAPQLSAEQKDRIAEYVRPFREYLNYPEGERDTQDRVYRRQFFQSFTPEKLAKLEETDLAELVANLWATSIFGNKHYFVERMLVQAGVRSLLVISSGYDAADRGVMEAQVGPYFR